MVEEKEDHKEFLAPKLDFKIVHYIEKRVKEGHPISEVKADLIKGGSAPEMIDKHIEYVNTHKGGVHHHTPWATVLYALAGVVFVSVIIAAVYWFLQ